MALLHGIGTIHQGQGGQGLCGTPPQDVDHTAQLQREDCTAQLHRTHNSLHVSVGWGPHGTAIGRGLQGIATEDTDHVAQLQGRDGASQLQRTQTLLDYLRSVGTVLPSCGGQSPQGTASPPQRPASLQG